MTLIAYRSANFRVAKLAIIEQANMFIVEFEGQKLTQRQIYYRFIGTDAFPDDWIDPAYNQKHGLPPDTKNTKKNYARLCAILTDARYAGLVRWDAIEDRVREPDVRSEWGSLADLLDSAHRAFRLPRWRGQKHYVELWVEKDALAGVLAGLAREFHVTLMVNKGYSSASAMFESAQRFLAREDLQPVLFYVGDHDPSGEDMVRDISDRLAEFGVADLDVRKIALTMAQVHEYRCPPNPAKTTDSRFVRYAAEHGNESWEVDALSPNVLVQLIRAAFDDVIDRPTMDAVIAQESGLKKDLAKFMKRTVKK